MLIPEEIYTWLVHSQIIPNQGEIDERHLVTLPHTLVANFDNGFLIGQIIRKLAVDSGKKIPNALATVKSDSNKNTRLTNWNFIWLAFESIGLKLDARIKELILQGEQALIVQILRQLHDRDTLKSEEKIVIRAKTVGGNKTGHAQAVDVKRINLSKDPEEAESSLQFLILLLRASLGMNLEEILGLFTNQNKYLAHIIVKGVNESFDPVILFYSLLNKHSEKLKKFYQLDGKDAEACLYALKPGFISKNQKVAELTIQLFGKLGNLYQWFVSQYSKCSGTLLLGLKRHPDLRQLYWILLLELIQGQQVEFFTKYYQNSFQNTIEMVQITCYLIKYISQSFLGQKLTSIGVIAGWLQSGSALPQDNLQSQTILFRLIGQLMLYLPGVIDQNQDCFVILSRRWQSRSLPQFITLFNELIVILQKLGQTKNALARRIYLVVADIAKLVGVGDKRDYLVQNFLPLISKFPTIPSQYLIQHIKRHPLSASQFLLICESIEINSDIETLVAVGTLLKTIFLQNPLLDFYVLTMIKQIALKVINDQENGVLFISNLVEESLQLYASLQTKYKPKAKQQQSMYFGKSGSPQKVPKSEEQELIIKLKWKDLLLQLVNSLIELAMKQQAEQLKQTIKEKIMNANAQIKHINHKVGSKALEEIMSRKFGITKDQQVQHSEEFSKKISANVEQSMLRRSKVQSNASVSLKLKGPENLTKQFQLVAQKRKQQEEDRKAQQLKKQLLQEKKKLIVKKQLQITNLLRGQIGEAQLREEGFLQRLKHQAKQLQLIPLDQLQARDVEAAENILKKHHKVLRYLFLHYTNTMYNSHTNQKFEDNQQRKQILSAVQLGKLLKDYKLAYLTSQTELNGLVRDINVKLLNRREVSQLDFIGFQQFIIQFCFLIYTRSHTITVHKSEGDVVHDKALKNQPIYIILKQFFTELKMQFIAKGQKVTLFDDLSDIPHTKQQIYEAEIFNKKLMENPAYILPKGYKKVVQKTIDFQHKFSPIISNIPEAYEIALDALDFIFSKNPLNMHIIQTIFTRVTHYKVKPMNFGNSQMISFPKDRAMSTYIERKSPLADIIKKRSSSKGLIDALKHLPSNQRKIGQEAAVVLDGIVNTIQKSKEKEIVKQKRVISIAKLQELQKMKTEAHLKRIKQKQETKQQQQRKEKQQEKRRREQTDKFLQEQRQKLSEKRKRDQQERVRKSKEEDEKQTSKKQIKQQFKVFHQSQLQRIKKIYEDASQKIKKEKEEEEEKKYRQEELQTKLREKIEHEDKKIIQTRKQIDGNITKLFGSESIKKVFQKYEPNLKSIFEFLIAQTFLSLTQKKHNNQIIFDTWRYFLTVFELSPVILQVKDVVYIFKLLTKDKIVPKEYYLGLNYQQFQQALFRIAIKHKTIFNMIADKIKDKVDFKEQPKVQKEEKKDKIKKSKKDEGQSKKEETQAKKDDTKKQEKKQNKKKKKQEKFLQKQQNQFDQMAGINVKELIKQNNTGKDSIDEYGDLSKVNQKTLLGLIYYLKVPDTKQGQETRFRAIMNEKLTASVHNSQRLKEKLSEEYTLQSPTKKYNAIKSLGNGVATASQKSIK